MMETTRQFFEGVVGENVTEEEWKSIVEGLRDYYGEDLKQAENQNGEAFIDVARQIYYEQKTT